ncbi:C40 family peptidase [Nocardiopsis flavescens]|uniref:Cell wall-associated hydrolase, NlpC family n=1 Tax=Nocardiopsis flavescens TaxID=758803 RepID=A0A1M6BIX7_9ACTN|nr:C40 family peptidase [Nocardiopsis flavescens]SHI48684.1 Cell wall-associated hydrolase, NlpC family [Nocardiopsis flavescens]
MTRNPDPVAARRRFATVGFAALGAVVLSSGVAVAEPTPEEARERYEALQEELSGLNETFNRAEEDHEAALAELEELEERLAGAEETLEEMSGKVAGIAQVAYTESPYSTFTVLFGGAPDAALQNVADLDYLSDGQQDVLSGYIEEVEHAERLHADAAETEEEAAGALEEAEAAQERGEEALEEQAEVLEALGGVDPTSGGTAGAGASDGGAVAASGDVQAVLDFARAQIGKPYVWGGTGPDGYDCSGLVQAAWAQAGVSLPRTTYDQVNAGTRISRDQVQPGDLLFFYSESAPSHVGIYSGNGMMIHGSNPSKPLEEVALAAYWDGVFTGAVRVG